MELPKSFLESLSALLGEGAQTVVGALDEEPVVSVRLNPFKTDAALREERVAWASDAYYLQKRCNFTFDPLFHAGCYYVQEASSMFLEQVVRQHVASPAVVLDLCAAPGGKSTLLRSVLPEGSLLVCNEYIHSRAQVLSENITKWGHPGCVVTNNAPKDFACLEGLFDVVVADVPCSGEGMFRKDRASVAEWSESNVELCWQRARTIIDDCWPSLKPGGLLVYSTCTYNIKEDEENIRYLRQKYGAEVLTLKTESDWNITGNLLPSAEERDAFPVYRFLPGRTRGEGFFLAVLRKPAEEGVFARKEISPTGKKGKKTRPLSIPTACKGWLTNPDSFCWKMEGNFVVAEPSLHSEILSLLRERLRVLQSGVSVASMKGTDCVPMQSLANSICLNVSAFPRAEVSYQEALAYLRRETIRLPENAPRGYVVVTYRDVPLGFVKNVGNRANNLYVNEWRIRTTYLPTEEFTLLS